MTQSAVAKAQLTAGETITYRTGSVVITLQATDTGTYTVETRQGPTRVAEWCYTYATETEARTAARHAAIAFRAHRTAEAIEARRAQISEALEDMRRRIARNYPINADERAALLTEDDALMSLGELALAARFCADMIRRHAA